MPRVARSAGSKLNAGALGASVGMARGTNVLRQPIALPDRPSALKLFLRRWRKMARPTVQSATIALLVVAGIIADMQARAARHGRTLRFGYRAHVVVRDTEAEARQAADRLLSKLDDAEGAAIRARSLDSHSTGVRAQAALREGASADGYAEPHLWTGIGRARSGCGAAIIGDPDQVLAKLADYQTMGIEAFILSGYPHAAEADLFARHVLPRMTHGPLLEA